MAFRILRKSERGELYRSSGSDESALIRAPRLHALTIDRRKCSSTTPAARVSSSTRSAARCEDTNAKPVGPHELCPTPAAKCCATHSRQRPTDALVYMLPP